jgi:hypothetical protein
MTGENAASSGFRAIDAVGGGWIANERKTGGVSGRSVFVQFADHRVAYRPSDWTLLNLSLEV